MTRLEAAQIDTPIGPFWMVVDRAVGADAVADGDMVVVASGWCTELGPVARHAGGARPDDVTVRRSVGAATDAAVAFHEGEVYEIDAITVRQHASAFLEASWEALRTIPAGSTITYRELAGRAGRPAAVRAAASACARNSAALFVPCHRVVRTGGGLGGFGWGLDVKRWLLAHEDKHR